MAINKDRVRKKKVEVGKLLIQWIKKNPTAEEMGARRSAGGDSLYDKEGIAEGSVWA
jgi:hypothetical protein